MLLCTSRGLWNRSSCSSMALQVTSAISHPQWLTFLPLRATIDNLLLRMHRLLLCLLPPTLGLDQLHSWFGGHLGALSHASKEVKQPCHCLLRAALPVCTLFALASLFVAQIQYTGGPSLGSTTASKLNQEGPSRRYLAQPEGLHARMGVYDIVGAFTARRPEIRATVRGEEEDIHAGMLEKPNIPGLQLAPKIADVDLEEAAMSARSGFRTARRPPPRVRMRDVEDGASDSSSVASELKEAELMAWAHNSAYIEDPFLDAGDAMWEWPLQGAVSTGVSLPYLEPRPMRVHVVKSPAPSPHGNVSKDVPLDRSFVVITRGQGEVATPTIGGLVNLLVELEGYLEVEEVR